MLIYAQNMPDIICLRYGTNKSEIGLRFALDMPDTYLKYAWDIRYAWDMCLWYCWYMPEIHLRYRYDMPDMCLKYA